MAEVVLEQVSKRFGSVVAVDGVSLTVAEGSFTSLLGPSGSGKTTLLRLLAGFERATSGTIRLGGRDVTAEPPDRRNVGMVFQNYALFPHLTVAENVAFGLRMRKVGRSETTRRVAEALAMVRLDGLAERYPQQLSGGQQQRVALARAIVIRPALLLLDEPLSALDRQLRAQMQVELRQLQREVGLTTLYVTHDQEEALAMSDRIAVINDGRIQQYATPREIYERPANEFVVSFIGVANLLSARVERQAEACVARVAGLERPLRLREGAQAGAARLAIRPERVRLSAEPHVDGLPARVLNVVYLGTSTHYYLELEGDGGSGLPLVAFAQNSAADGNGSPPLAPGAPAWVSWQPSSVIVLPG